jgi:hypothetical protein
VATGGSGTGAYIYSAGSSTACSVGSSTGALTITSGTGTCSITATRAADGNYNVSAPSSAASVAVSPASQATVIITAPTSATFGQTGLSAVATGGSGTGAYIYSAGSSTACTVESSTGALTISSGSGTCSVTATRAADGNYNVSAPSSAASVTVIPASQAAVIITAPTSATFGQAGLSAVATGGSGTGAYIYSAGSSAACSVGSTGVLTITSGTGTCSITATRAADGNYNVSAPSSAASVAVSLASQATVIIAAPTSATFGQAGLSAVATGGSGTGAYIYSAGSSTACTVGSSTGVLTITSGTGACSITATRAADGNYNVSAPSSAASVTVSSASQATLAVTGVPGTAQAYGTIFTVGSSGGSGSGAMTFAATGACSNIGATVTITSGSGICSVTATKAADTNYNTVTSAAVSLGTTNALLTVGVQAATKTYGAVNPPFTLTYLGFVNGDSAAALIGTPTFTTSATVSSPLGIYSVMPGGVSAANYTIVFAPGTLTVGKAPLTVTANNLNRVFGVANPTLTYTITGFQNQDPSSVVSGAASCSTTATTSSAIGGYPITCTQGSLASTNYTFSFVAGTLTVSSPDLIVKSVSVTGTPLSGGSLTVTDTTTNQGNSSAGISYTYFYLSSDGKTGLGGALSYRSIATLAAGASSGPGTTSVTLSTNLNGGPYYILACANATNLVPESNTANNCLASASFNVVGPDLVETSVSVTGAPLSGGVLSVTDTTSNQAGGGAAGNSDTYFYLSSDGKTALGGALNYRFVSALASGASSGPATTNVTLPTNLNGGPYYILACANGNSGIVESNTTNNCRASASFSVAGPDLIVTSVSVTGTPVSGGSLSVTDTTTNQAGGGAAGNSYTYFYLSSDGKTGLGGALNYRFVGALASGASSGPATTSVILPTNAKGTYFILACANGNNALVESNTANDCNASASFTIH